MGSIGLTEMAIIGAVLVIIFGPSQLPRLGRSIGETIREFRHIGKEMKDFHES